MTLQHINSEFAVWGETAKASIDAIVNATSAEERDDHLDALLEIGTPKAVELIEQQEILEGAIANQKLAKRRLNRRRALASSGAAMQLTA